MIWILYGAMAVCGLGMIYTYRLSQAGKAPWAMPVSMLLGAVTVGLVGYVIYQNLMSSGNAVANAEQQFQMSACHKVGETLANNEALAGRGVLVTYPHRWSQEDFNTMFGAFKSGLDGKLEVLDTVQVQIPPIDEEDWQEGVEYYSPELVDSLIEKYAEQDLGVVYLMGGPPMDWPVMQALRDGEPKIALDSANGRDPDLHYYLNPEQAAIAVLTAAKPLDNDILRTPPTGNYDKDFNVRYLLVTPENFQEAAAANPGIFGSPEE